MDTKAGAGLIATAVIGGAATIIAGWIGFQSGQQSVNKDYVQIAVANLTSPAATPEMRKWSVQVLDKMSPVPFDEPLKVELVGSRPPILIPEFAKTACPDLIGEDKGKPPLRSVDDLNRSWERFVRAYAECRRSFIDFRGYIEKLNEPVRVSVPAK